MIANMTWYIARSSGIVAWLLLAGSVLWGLALSTKVLRGKPRPNWILDLHRFLGGIALVFTGVHVLVPFTGRWHPVAVAWGVVGLYLLAAVEITSLLRKKLSKRAWRLTHYLSFPLFALTTAHTLSAGTDCNTFLLRWTCILVVASVVVLTGLRVRKADKHDLLTSPASGAAARAPRSRVPAR